METPSEMKAQTEKGRGLRAFFPMLVSAISSIDASSLVLNVSLI